MLQKAQLRVHTPPRMRNVAVPLEKHSNMFGHLALWQTVLSLRPSTSARVSAKVWLQGSFTLSHGGMRKDGAELVGADMLDLLHGNGVIVEFAVQGGCLCIG